MTSQLIQIFTPTYKDTEQPDYRYKEDLLWIFKDAGHQVLNGLQKFKDEKQRIEVQYGKFAFQFTRSWLKRIEYIEEDEGSDSDSLTNKYRFRSKGLLKHLREKLNELGFNSSNVSKIIGAAKYSRELETHKFDGNYDFGGSEAEDSRIKLFHSWTKKLPVRSLYVLSLMDRADMPCSESHSKLYEVTNGFKHDVSRRELEEIRRLYPKYDKENPWKSLPQAFKDDTDSTRELLEKTQDELIKDLVTTVKMIDLDVVYGNDSLRADLEVASRELIALGEMGRPIPTKPTYV